jgi:SAM-dependent methyltransferase
MKRKLPLFTCLLLAGSPLLRARTAQPPSQSGHEQHMEHRFDPEEWAKSFDSPDRDAWQKPGLVLAALNLKDGQVVADIGAGTGYFTARLARAAARPKVYAADIEPEMVEYLKRRA